MDANFLRSILNYNKDTGIFTWLPDPQKPKYWNTRYVGQPAGSVFGNGGFYVSIFKKKYKVSRLIWLYIYGRWPNGYIDHKDGNPLNNKLENLREATYQQNQQNQKLRYNNKSGFKGVGPYGQNNKWRAYIGHEGKFITLGYFNTAEEAYRARVKAEKELYGEFARL